MFFFGNVILLLKKLKETCKIFIVRIKRRLNQVCNKFAINFRQTRFFINLGLFKLKATRLFEEIYVFFVFF